jgi:hypothetical protein
MSWKRKKVGMVDGIVGSSMALVLKTADQRKKVFLNFSLLLLRIRGA